MGLEPSDATTSLLPGGTVGENVIVLRYGPNCIDELTGLAEGKHLFDAVVVDVVESGFLFPADVLMEAYRQAQRFLAIQGALVFVKSDKAVALVRESLVGLMSFRIFDTLAELYDYSPLLAGQIQSCLGKETGAGEQSTNLAEQVLMSSVPVLTSLGIKLKAGLDSSARRNLVLAAIDNYTPLSAIAQKLVGQGKMTLEELKEELRSLEHGRAIFPVFAKVPFLVHCFANKVPFKLKDYLVAARFLTQDQLDEVAVEHIKGKNRLNLGALAVAKGYLTSRQLEVSLQDQAFYGQAGDADKVKMMSTADEHPLVQSLVGHLGTTDPSGLLQSLSNNRETGVLSVELRDLQFRALFDQGKLTHAKLGKIKGNLAITEFASVWREGIFVFIHRQPPPDLADNACKVGKPLDKLLLDAALANDHIDVVCKKLPKGLKTPLERREDVENLWHSTRLVDPKDNTILKAEDLAMMHRLWSALDGLSPLVTIIKSLGDTTTLETTTAVDRLLHYQLVSVPAADVSGPLHKFQQIAKGVGEKVGFERNIALLRLTLQATQGYSIRSRMFTIGSAGEIGIDFAAAKSAGASLSMIAKDLEDWQVKYVEYVSQELDRNVLRDIVYKAHQR